MINIPLKAVFLVAAYSAVHTLVCVLYSAKRERNQRDIDLQGGDVSGGGDFRTPLRRRAADISRTELRNRIIVASLTLLALLVLLGALIAYH